MKTEKNLLALFLVCVVFFIMDGFLAHGQPAIPLSVGFWYPTNGETYTAPANIGLHAQVADSVVVETVQYFSGTTNIGIVTNKNGVLVTNLNTDSPFYLLWSNVAAGSYKLTAVATDSNGVVVTSSPVTISVVAPVVRPSIYIPFPTNNSVFHGPTNLTLYARAVESGGTIASVQFFAGSNSLGIVTNGPGVQVTNLSIEPEPLFPLTWSNVPLGNFVLTAVAVDGVGNSSTSSVVNISVVTNPPPMPFTISFYYPTNGESYLAPATVAVHALVLDSNVVETVQYFANGTNIGIRTNSSGILLTNSSAGNPFELNWSNVLAGAYALTAVATDGKGIMVTSLPVNITVTNPPPPPPIPFTVSFYYPTNGEFYLAPATVGVHALVLDSNIVETVQYFANGTNIGVRTNSSGILLTNSSTGNPFELNWSNVLAGAYALTAVATDAKGIMVTSSPVNITVTNPPPPPPIPFTVSFYYPTNGEFYLAPATVGVHALVLDSNIVETVQYFANGTNIGVRTNSSGILLTNSSTGNPFELNWSNVLAGAYALTAVATDAKGIMVTSSPVNITVTNPPPPPPVPFTISFYYPTNGEFYLAPATIGVHALVLDSNIVETVQYFANGTNIGVRTNSSGILLTNSTTANPFFLAWSNVPAGNYALIAVATDAKGIMVTSSPVNITVTNPPPPPPVPFTISFYYPTNGEFYLAPATIGVHALVLDSNIVETVQYFANGTNIGIRTNSSGILLTNSSTPNPFFLAWSNVPVGTYSLIAVATDASGATATSAPVNIIVVSNLPPTVSIYAPDPVAVEGTNLISFTPTNGFTNYCSGSNTATFLVLRNGATNVDLAVDYSIGGTASNGVDYATIPDQVTILAGQRYALITIVPLNDNDTNRPYDTVVLTLTVPPYPTNTLPPYLIGSPGKAGAIILENGSLPILQPLARLLIDGSVHTSLPGTNGMNFCVQVSTDLVNWLPICTNTILKGSAQFVDPDATASPKLFYRAVFVPAPPSY